MFEFFAQHGVAIAVLLLSINCLLVNFRLKYLQDQILMQREAHMCLAEDFNNFVKAVRMKDKE